MEPPEKGGFFTRVQHQAGSLAPETTQDDSPFQRGMQSFGALFAGTLEKSVCFDYNPKQPWRQDGEYAGVWVQRLWANSAALSLQVLGSSQRAIVTNPAVHPEEYYLFCLLLRGKTVHKPLLTVLPSCDGIAICNRMRDFSGQPW